MRRVIAETNALFFVSTTSRSSARGNIRKLFSLGDYIRRKKVMFFSKSKTSTNNVNVIPLLTISSTVSFIFTPTQFCNRKDNISFRSCQSNNRRRNENRSHNNKERNEGRTTKVARRGSH